MTIHSVIHRYVQKTRTTMMRAGATSLILVPLSLVGCASTQQPAGVSFCPQCLSVNLLANNFRTATDGPVVRPEPISVDQRASLEGRGRATPSAGRVALIIGNSDYQRIRQQPPQSRQ